MASREKEEALEHLLYQAMQQSDGEEQEAQLIAQNNLLKIEMQKRKQSKRLRKKPEVHIVTQNAANMKKIVKAFIIQMVTMKHLQDQRNRKAWKIKMHTLSAVV